MRSSPTWYSKAAALLVQGKTQAEVAKAVGVWAKTLRRHITAPDGLLRSLIEAERTKQAAQAQDELAPLRDGARQLVKKAIDDGDIDVALKVFAKTTSTPEAAPPPETETEPEISVEDAYREVALSLSAAADLARLGTITPELVEMLRSACRVFLTDDLQPRPPIEVEAERVEVAAPEMPQQVNGAGAAVIPIR